MHQIRNYTDQAIYLACLDANRLDFNRRMDGIYDENGDQDWRTPVDSILGLNKPVWLWDHCGSQERGVAKDTCARDDAATHAWLARTMLHGAMPTTPYPPCGDHTITSTNINASTLQIYEAFTPLWALLKEKEWVLLPRAVSVNDSAAAATNIFCSGGKLVVPVLNVPGWGQRSIEPNASLSVTIAAAAIASCGVAVTCEVRYPILGRGPLQATEHAKLPGLDSDRVFDVQLQQGFAVLVCS